MSALTGLLRPGRWNRRSLALIDREIDDELDFHIECRTQDLIATGMTPEQAAEEANRMFGARESIRLECRSIGYGYNLWLIVALSSSFLVLLTVISWLTVRLNSVRHQNQEMLSALQALQPAEEQKGDLAGEITDIHGEPVAGARVLLIYKSWPRSKYQQNAFETVTEKDGKFRFPGLYSPTMQTAFLVTVLADGHAMQSQYVIYKANEAVKSFGFKLKPALEKTFIVQSRDGRPLAETIVFPSTRKPQKATDEFLMYDQSAEAAGFRTDADGKVRMALFEAGDAVELGIMGGERIDLVVDESSEQTVGAASARSSKDGIRGTVLDDSGKPIPKAKILLILKSWPGGRFRQEPSDTTTESDGTFAFAEGNQTVGREAFLVTVVKEGFAFQSRYVMKKDGQQVDPFAFQLAPAMDKTLVLQDGGRPLADINVALSSRKEADSDEHMLYAASAPSVSFRTDQDGKVELKHFAAGDAAKLLIETSDGWTESEFEVDRNPEQLIDVKKKVKRQ